MAKSRLSRLGRAGSSVQPEQFLGGYNGEGKDFKLYYIRPEKYASHDNGALASDNGGWASGSHINEIVAGSNTVLYDAVLEFWYGEPSATTHRVPLGLTWQSDKSCSGETLTTLEEANPIECFHECMGSPAPRECQCINWNTGQCSHHKTMAIEASSGIKALVIP